jgi:putative nucleotidyltransferase with HDIG domain
LRISVGVQVIAPFVILSLVLGLLTSALVSQQLATSASNRLDALATREEDAVATAFDSFEQRQLTDLRLLAGTAGVPAALAKGDKAALQDLLYPAVANQFPDPLQASVVDPGGKEILGMSAEVNRPAVCRCTSGRSLLAWPHVAQVLQGISDAQGPKYVGMVSPASGPVLYTVGPVTSGTRTVGALVVAEPLGLLVNQVRRSGSFETAVFAPGGSLLAASRDFPTAAGQLSPAERNQLTAPSKNSVHLQHTLSGASVGAEAFFVPVVLRGTVLGYASVVVPATVVGAAAGTLPMFLVGVFFAAMLLTVATGMFVTRRITRRLARLVHATDQVAAGDLEHTALATSNDELGQLAAHFNAMTGSLREMTDQLASSTEETVRALAAAIDARDAYTHGHSVRVTNYSVELARAAGLSPKELETVQRGGLIHDIGKIGVPDRILSKPGRLTNDEAAEMRMHPVVGHKMLQHLRWYGDVLDIVLHHHERWDGSGYPAKLSGPDIPTLARLVAIADTLDAMTSHRPYRKAYTFTKAAAAIEGGAGTQFDPEMIEVFRQVKPVLRNMVQAEFSVGGPSDTPIAEVIEMVAS